MRRILYILLLLVGQVAFGLDWMAFGDMRGEIEPCGCDPKVDYGGLRRLAMMVKRNRSENEKLMLFNLGNSFQAEDTDPLKMEFIHRGLQLQIRPTANLFNVTEAKSLGKSWFQHGTYVAYNWIPMPKDTHHGFKKKPEIKKYILKDNVLITGLVEAKGYLPWSQQFQNEFTTELMKVKSAAKILLFSGSNKTLLDLKNSGLFDLIITASTRSLEDHDKGRDELLAELQRLPKIWMVPAFTKGALVFMTQSKPSLESVFSSKSSTTSVGEKSIFKTPSKPKDPEPKLLKLSYDYHNPHMLKEFFESYQINRKKEFELLAQGKLKDLAHSPFVGSQQCKGCHEAEYKVWDNSGHAYAFDILTRLKQAENRDCVGCHVLGYDEKGGFISNKATPQFAHVNCENCHSNTKNHVRDPSINVTSDKDRCKSCHNQAHSPNFDFKKYWPKIAHGKK